MLTHHYGAFELKFYVYVQALLGLFTGTNHSQYDHNQH